MTVCTHPVCYSALSRPWAHPPHLLCQPLGDRPEEYFWKDNAVIMTWYRIVCITVHSVLWLRLQEATYPKTRVKWHFLSSSGESAWSLGENSSSSFAARMFRACKISLRNREWGSCVVTGARERRPPPGHGCSRPRSPVWGWLGQQRGRRAVCCPLRWGGSYWNRIISFKSMCDNLRVKKIFRCFKIIMLSVIWIS